MTRKVFCLPYAGGSSNSIYSKWVKLSDEDLQIVPIEFPGRGSLFGEKCYETVEEATIGTLEKIEKQIHNCEYGIWGHSMGAIVAYELGRLIDKKNT